MINASMSVCQVTFFGPHELPALHPYLISYHDVCDDGGWNGGHPHT